MTGDRRETSVADVRGSAATGGGGISLRLFLLRLFDFFFLTVVSFGHNELRLVVEPQLRRFARVLQ